VTIRLLEPDDGTDALWDLQGRAFGQVGGGRAAWQAEHELSVLGRRYLAAFDGARLVAAARFHDMQQWWNGRPVPMAGVASVAVVPEERGKGVGRALMTALLELIASRGYPLSVLFPSTLPIYRSLGWEIAGTSHEAVIPAHALRSLAAADPAVPAGPAFGGPASGGPVSGGPVSGGPVSGGPASDGPASGGLVAGGPERSPAAGEVRRAGADDAAEAIDVLGRVYRGARDCGPSTGEAGMLGLALGSERFYGYLAPDGLLLYRWRAGHDEIFVQVAVAASAQTTRALWGIVGSHCWMAHTVRARIGPTDPMWWLTHEPVADAVDHDDWMLRVVDPAAAVAARGFPPAARLSVPLRIADAARPANSGLWRLEVRASRGSLVRDGGADEGPGGGAAGGGAAGGGADGNGGPLALGARGLAALYAGTPVATLRRAGLAAGGNAVDDALLDGAFAATPYLLDRF
jgi:predicted N-acetyltransferase YhbS